MATRLRGMRRFCRWLVTGGELDTAPTDSIEIVTPPEKPVPVLTDFDVRVPVLRVSDLPPFAGVQADVLVAARVGRAAEPDLVPRPELQATAP